MGQQHGLVMMMETVMMVMMMVAAMMRMEMMRMVMMNLARMRRTPHPSLTLKAIPRLLHPLVLP